MEDVEFNLIVEALKEEFKDKSKEQQTLLACRKIIELADDPSQEQIKLKVVHAIFKASECNCNPIILAILNSMYENTKKMQDLYAPALESYYKVLRNYQGLAQELGIDSALDLSHLFTYMLWNGYYSVNKKHFYQMQERTLISGMYSFDVIKGGGVCLAYAELLHNYLTVCGKTSSILECQVPAKKEEITCNYRPEIQRNMQISCFDKIAFKILEFLLKALINKVGNHSVTLIEENDKLYIYDPTNLYVLNVKDKNTATVINGTGSFELKPLLSLVLLPYADPYQLFEKLISENFASAFTQKDIIFSFENMMELINSHHNLLDDAYDNIHSELEIIDKQIIKRKKN